MSLSKISSGGQTSICKISTGGQTSASKISSGGANDQVAFSTGGQMSINRFINWGVNVLWGHMYWNRMKWVIYKKKKKLSK